MISVVIPVYNVENYIEKCLESITNQTKDNYEIILINDGSTDSSGLICESWSEKNSIIRYVNKSNEGLGPTRNLGVCLAKGEYVCFLDSDDWVTEDYIEKLYEESIRYPDADLFMFEHICVHEATGKVSIVMPKVKLKEINFIEQEPEMIYANEVAMWNKMYKRDFLIENLLWIPNLLYEDYAIYPSIVILANKCIYMKNRLLFYRQAREKSIVNIKENRRRAIDVIKYILTDAKTRGYFEAYRFQLERICTRFVSLSLREMVKLHDYDELKKVIEKFMIDMFPEWHIPYMHKIYVDGSNDLYCMVNQIMYNLNCTCYDRNRDKLEEGFDYYFVDFQPNKYIIEDRECYINRIDNILKCTSEERIVLVENYLYNGYGDREQEKLFDEQEEIYLVNQQLRDIYKEIRDKYTKIKVIEIDDDVKYADINSRHGCAPWNGNDKLYMKGADIMIKNIMQWSGRKDRWM